MRNILDFDEQFPGAKVVKLEQNYRSTAPILAVANAVISKRADSKYNKSLFTDKPGGEKVRLGVAAGPEAEAAYVARELRRIIREENKKPKDCAILYRSNGQAKLLEEQLREQGVPYRMIGGQQFFERKEVKDLLAYLKVALNRADEISLRRVINYPPRGIGDTSVEKLSQHALAKGWSLWQAIERVDALDGIPTSAREGCKQLERIVGDMRKKLMIDRAKASAVTRDLCETIGLRKDIDQTSTSTNAATRRWSNVEGILGVLTRREARVTGKGQDDTAERELMSFLHSLTLQVDEEEDDPGNVVTLSTLHGSKGLEFDNVFLIGCEEGLIPHSRTLEVKASDATGAGRRGGAPPLLRRRDARRAAARSPALQVPHDARQADAAHAMPLLVRHPRRARRGLRGEGRRDDVDRRDGGAGHEPPRHARRAQVSARS